MKKALFILLVFSLLSTSCSIFTDDIEPVTFLETHNLSVWERTDDSGQKSFLRILSDSKKIAKIYTGITDRNCYKTEFTQKINDKIIDEDTVSRLRLIGYNEYDNSASFSLSIIDGVLYEDYWWQVVHSTGGYNHVWVRSEVNVEDLKLCD